MSQKPAASTGQIATGPGATRASGVTPTKRLSDLTAEDALRFCDWAQALAEPPSLEASCTYAASAVSADPAECAEIRDECVSENEIDFTPADSEESRAECAGEVLQGLGSCAVTVAAYEACVREEVLAFFDAVASASCVEPAPGSDEKPTPACDAIYAQCPELVEDVDPDEADGGFVCDSGNDIPDDYVCDGFDDCAEAEDEQECAGRSAPFVCDDGESISRDWVCDAYDDCENGEDEAGCEGLSGAQLGPREGFAQAALQRAGRMGRAARLSLAREVLKSVPGR